MKKLSILSALFAGALLLLLSGSGETQQQFNQFEPPEGIEPLTRGPVHEAYADLYSVDLEPYPIVPLEPPDPIEEMPPEEQPEGDSMAWIPGYWGWDEDMANFVWISGFWRDVPPGHYWVPGYWIGIEEGWQYISGYWAEETRSEFAYLPYPPASLEAGPSIPPPSETHFYVPGLWVYHETRYVWRPGFWLEVPVGWMYVPPRYVWTPVGCIFINGYWDYPLHRRGVLYTPIVFHEALWTRPGWFWQPRFVVPPTTLYTSLFARPMLRHYYFGDYFAPGYMQAGFVPWHQYNVVRNVPSPLFSYYRIHQDRAWVNNVQQVFVDRREGRLPRPPRTWNQQVQVIQNIQTRNVIQVGDRAIQVQDPQLALQQMTMAAPLNAVAKLDKQVRVRQVPKEVLAREQQAATQMRKVIQERQQADVKFLKQDVKEKAPKARFTIPKEARVQREVERKVETPPPPKLPKQVEKPIPEDRKPVKPPRLDRKPLAPQDEPPVFDPKEKKKPPVFDPKQPFDPKEEKKPVLDPKERKKPPVFDPKEEKKLPVIDPKEKKPPVFKPKEEKKLPVFDPKEEKKPPVFKPKEEKKPPVFEPKKKPAFDPREEKKPPVFQPPEKKFPKLEPKDVQPPVLEPKKKAAPPPVIQPPQEKKPLPQLKEKGKPVAPQPPVFKPKEKGKPVAPQQPPVIQPKEKAPTVQPPDPRGKPDRPQFKGKQKDDDEKKGRGKGK